MLLLAAFLVGAAWAAFVGIKRVQRERMAEHARAAGLQAYREGSLQNAINELSYYFQQEKDDLEVNLAFADARSRLPLPGGRHLFEAIDLYTRHGLELIDRQGGGTDQQRFDILKRLLELSAQLGDRERVASTADALLQIDPGMIDAMAARAEVHFLSREFEDTERIATRLIELDPDSLRWRRMLLEVHSRQGASTDSQIEQCRAWSETYTADARFRLLAAAMLVDAGRMDEARAELRDVASLSANSQAVLEQLVSLLDALGMSADADAALASTAARFPAQWWPREASIKRDWQRDEPERALQQIADARGAMADEPPSIRRLEVVSLLSAGRRDDARRALQPLLQATARRESDADRLWAAAVSAAIDADKGQWRAAADALQMALSAAPHDAVLQFLMGDLDRLVGEQAKAIADYQRAYLNAPNWATAGVACGRALLDAGRLSEAFDTARIVVTRSGVSRLQPFLLYVHCYLALREAGTPADMITGGELTGDILAALKKVLEQEPNQPEVAALLARAHLAAGDREAAVQFMRDTLSRSDVNAETLLALAEVAARARLDLEESLLTKARDVGGLSLPVAFALADTFAHRGQAGQGLALIDQAIASVNDQASLQNARCARAAYLLRTGTAEGLQALSAAVTEFRDSAEVQRFALSQPQAWSDQRLIAQAMGNLHRLLGDDSVQVRLAEANFLIQHQGNDRAMLAKAVATINGVLEEAPDSLAALSLAADAAMMGERPDLGRATECLERAASVYVGEPSLLVRLVAALQRQGRFDAARRHLQELSLLLERHPEYATDELRLLQAQGEFETALVRASATVNETSPPPQQLLLAAAMERTGRVADAEAIYERLLTSHPDDPLVLSQAAEFYAGTGRFQRGLELIQRLPLQPGGAGRQLLVGVFQQRHGHVVEAGESLRAAVEADPKSTDAHNELARHYLSIDQPLKAREQAMAGLRVDATHVGLRSTLAIANLAMPGSDRSEAIRLLRDIGSGNDALLAMLELLERVPVTDGKAIPTEENLVEARQLTESHAMFLPAWQMAMALHLEAGRRNDAMAIAREAIGRLPGEPQPAAWATQLLMQAGRWDEALAEAQEWRRRTLADPLPADAATARILLVRERPADAVALLLLHRQRLIDNRRESPDGLLTLIEALVRAGETSQAREIITPILSEDARWRMAWIAAAGLMRPPDAEALLQDMEPRAASADERLALAMAWLAVGQQSGSESHLSRAESLALPLQHEAATSIGALIAIGAIAEARTDLSAAERAYRSVLATAPQNAVALNNLAFVLAVQNRCDEALPLIEQALKQQPDQPDFLDTYSVVLRGAQRLEDSESALHRALGGRPDDPALMLSLADVQLARGHRDDAMITCSQVQRRSASLTPKLLARLDDLRKRIDSEPPQTAPAGEGSAADASDSSTPTVP